MYKRNAVIGVIAVALVLLVAGNTFAYDQKSGGSHDKGLDEKILKKAHVILVNAEELGLAEKQIDDIKAWKITTKKQVIKLNADIEVFKLDVYAQMWQDSIDVATVNGLIDQLYGLKANKNKLMVEAYINLMELLTEKQKVALKVLCRKEMSGKR